MFQGRRALLVRRYHGLNLTSYVPVRFRRRQRGIPLVPESCHYCPIVYLVCDLHYVRAFPQSPCCPRHRSEYSSLQVTMAAVYRLCRSRLFFTVSVFHIPGPTASNMPWLTCGTRIIFFNGFEVFTHKDWNKDVLTDFFTAYIGIPIFFGLYIFWKLFKRTKVVKPENADITTGKAALDAEVWPEQIPRNALEKFWFWLV